MIVDGVRLMTKREVFKCVGINALNQRAEEKEQSGISAVGNRKPRERLKLYR